MVKEMQNVIISRFEIESEAFQAFSVLKNDARTYSCRISQASIVKRENGEFRILDAFNDGKYSDDTFTGGMIGMFIGILGGPSAFSSEEGSDCWPEGPRTPTMPTRTVP